MYDDKCLVDLINQRFDDMNAKIADLKSDMVRGAEDIKKRHDEHEVHDEERFKHTNSDLSNLRNLKLTVMGAASGAFVVVQAAAEVLKHYLK